jgi:hypothetical protein
MVHTFPGFLTDTHANGKNVHMQYINVRVRKETQHKLKILSALLDESMLDTLDRLVTQELDRVQKGRQDEALKKDQASRE